MVNPPKGLKIDLTLPPSTKEQLKSSEGSKILSPKSRPPGIGPSRIPIISPSPTRNAPLIPKKVKTVHLKKSMGLAKKYIIYQETPGIDALQNSKILSPLSRPPILSPRATRSGKHYGK